MSVVKKLPPLSKLVGGQNVFNLPRLPIPTLEATALRYGRSCEGLAPIVIPADDQPSGAPPICLGKFTQELQAHLATLDNFVKTSGAKIQQELIARDNAAAKTGEYPFSYIEPIWDDGYLDFDDPLPMYVSPGYSSLPVDPSWSQAKVAANLARSCAKWLIAAWEGDLAKPTKDGQEACLSGLRNQMGFARKPGALRDALHVAATLEDAIRYVTVICKGHIYLVSLVNQKGKLRSAHSLEKAFSTILATTKDHAPAELPVPILTTTTRRDWFKNRSALNDAHPGNNANLRYIEDSLTVICLDDHTSLTNSQKTKNQITGVGRAGIANRWCDKHQLIVSAVPGDGFSATCEHAFSDAMVWSEWLNAVYKDMVNDGSYLPNPARIIITEKEQQEQLVIPSTTTSDAASSASSAPSEVKQQQQQQQKESEIKTTTSEVSNLQHHHHEEGADEDDALLEKPVTEEEVKQSRNTKRLTPSGAVEQNGVICLSFKLNEFTTQAIKTAHDEFDKETANLKQVGIILPFGKNDCKTSLKISPDAICQAAYHLGYARTHNMMAPTYESCSTGKFFHGRTETIRSASPEMNSFVKSALFCRGGGALSSENAQTISKALRAAGEAHKKLGVDAGNGEGVDRHLLALKYLVKEFSDKAGLAFFSEPMYGRSGSWLMSTSNVSQPSLNWFSFGPVTPLGYGLGYCVKDDVVNVAISSTRNGYPTENPEIQTDADLLAKNVQEAAEDIVSYLTKK